MTLCTGACLANVGVNTPLCTASWASVEAEDDGQFPLNRKCTGWSPSASTGAMTWSVLLDTRGSQQALPCNHTQGGRSAVVPAIYTQHCPPHPHPPQITHTFSLSVCPKDLSKQTNLCPSPAQKHTLSCLVQDLSFCLMRAALLTCNIAPTPALNPQFYLSAPPIPIPPHPTPPHPTPPHPAPPDLMIIANYDEN